METCNTEQNEYREGGEGCLQTCFYTELQSKTP